MVELKIEISDDLKRKMSELPIDWSVVISTFIREKAFEWARLRNIVDKSELSEEDALEIGRKVNKGLAKRYKKMMSSE
jgi:hypothetical protein